MATYDEVKDKINQAGNMLNTPKYQDPNYLGQATNSILESQKPQLNQQNALTNQQYNNSAQKLAEQMAASGANRGGNATRQTMALEQGRNAQLGTNYNNMYSQAQNQAQNQAQLGLSEANMLQNQQMTAAQQLAALLAQQQNSQFNEASLTGQYNGQQTLAAQQLANQIAQQMLANKYTEAGLTGQYNGQNTLAKQQQEWAQNNARDLLATQLWGAYLENAQNASVPQTAVDWINQIFRK